MNVGSEATPGPDAPVRGRRRGRTWMLAVMGVLLLAGVAYWATRVDRDPRLLGDWYSPGGALFRFHDDGRAETFLPTKNGLAIWATRHWHTEDDVIRMASRTSTLKRRWDQVVDTVRPSGVQSIALLPDDYQVLKWGTETLTVQRISRHPKRIPPVEEFTRTPPVRPVASVPPGPAAPAKEP